VRSLPSRTVSEAEPTVVRPVLLSTWSFAERGHDAAWPALAAGGSALDAVLAVCDACERDEGVDSVGYGGLPDADGRVTLDACVMLAPDRVGAVAALSRHLPAAAIARAVMERTEHVLLAGEGADRFADEQGFAPTSLLAPAAAERFARRLARRSGGGAGVTPAEDDEASLRPVDHGRGRLFGHHDTICSLAVDASGTLAGATSTSGMPWKRPGRVGDSPIPGHGLFVDPRFGAAAATGTGELAMGACASFLVVELLRAGYPPTDALAGCLGRIDEEFTLRPKDQLGMIALTPNGDWAAAALRPGFRVVHSEGAGGVTGEAPALRPDDANPDEVLRRD